MAIRPLRSTFTLEVLTDAQVEKVKNATLQVLDEIGVQIRSNQLLAELGRAGARTDEATSTARGGPIVRFPLILGRNRSFGPPRANRPRGRPTDPDHGNQDAQGDGVGTLNQAKVREAHQSNQPDLRWLRGWGKLRGWTAVTPRGFPHAYEADPTAHPHGSREPPQRIRRSRIDRRGDRKTKSKRRPAKETTPWATQ